MNLKKLFIRSLHHYLLSHLASAGGIAIATALICGAIIIGDSLKYSLKQIVGYRLGEVTHSITAGERVFTKNFADNINKNENVYASAVLKTEAMAVLPGGTQRINKVQVWGVDSSFALAAGHENSDFDLDYNEAFISHNLASRLAIDTGEFLQLHITNTGIIPSNTPFVSEEKQHMSRRVKIKKILDKDHLGHFNLQASQSAPYNVLVNIDWLNKIMELENKANLILLRAENLMPLENIMNIARKAWQPEDGNLKVSSIEGKKTKIESERVFIDTYMSDEIKNIFPDAALYLTYFVSSLKHGELETPYSFVTAKQNKDYELKANDVIVNAWLAEDLKLSLGDTLYMTYDKMGTLRELTTQETYFIVRDIISMQQAASDHVLAPYLPGLSDAGSCRDWETGIPITLSAIRQKDEDYWRDYKGTPKAYISLERGQELWQNRFGSLTTVMLPSDKYPEENVRQLLAKQINPFRLEFQVNEVRKYGLDAANKSVDFGQLFASLSFFIIVAGLLLSALMLSLSLKKRQAQIKLYASLGFSKRLITQIMAGEMFLVSLIGGVAGLFFSMAYSKLVLMALNAQWYDIVRTDVLMLHFNPLSLSLGLFASVLLGLAVMYAGIRKAVSRSFVKHTALKSSSRNTKRYAQLTFLLSVLLLFVAASLVAYLVWQGAYYGLLIWFIVGMLLFFSMLTGIYSIFSREAGKTSTRFGKTNFILKNLSRQPASSFAIIVLLAAGSFVIVLTAANSGNDIKPLAEKSAGHGGFLLMAETTIPVLHHVNNSEKRIEYGLSDDINVVQFASVYDDDASCLNLNMVANPRIIATNPENLKGRFSFAARHALLDINEPWLSLNKKMDGLVPAIADQTVIQWGLGKKIGDTLTYLNARGESIHLLLIGGLSNSVFQGNVIISEDHFTHHFPGESGTNVFLIEAPAEKEAYLQEELGFLFRDYGWEMRNTSQKLAEFNTVQNTYLRIFFLMGALGMLVGTIGLMVFVARSLLERRREVALLSAMGYPNKTIAALYFKEYAFLFLCGLFIGSIAAVTATLPTFLSGSPNVSTAYLILTQAIIIANGLLWIYLISTLMIRKMNVREALGYD